MNIPNELQAEINKYCEVNNLEVEKFMLKILKQGFTVEKYGFVPSKVIEIKPEPPIQELIEVKEEVKVEIKEEKIKKDIYDEG